MSETYSFDELCRALGKFGGYARSIQSGLDLYIPQRKEPYSESYFRFMQRVVALRTLNVAIGDIKALLEKEKKLLELLHFDSINDSPIWYMSDAETPPRSDRHLLLTGHDLGFSLQSNEIQSNLDFRERAPELFRRDEMGEDVRDVVRLYLKVVKKIATRVQQERPVLEDALAWAAKAF